MNSVGDIGPEGLRAEHIRRLVDAAPPLSEIQRARLAAVLRPFMSRPAVAAKSVESRKAQRAA